MKNIEITPSILNELGKRKAYRSFYLYSYMQSCVTTQKYTAEWLADKVGWNVNTVWNALNTLQECGYVSYDPHSKPAGFCLRKIYKPYNSKKGVLDKKESAQYPKLIIPEGWKAVFDAAKANTIEAALNRISGEDRRFLEEVCSKREDIYIQLIKDVYSAIAEKHPKNEMGYTVAVLGNKLQEYRKQYSYLLKSQETTYEE